VAKETVTASWSQAHFDFLARPTAELYRGFARMIADQNQQPKTSPLIYTDATDQAKQCFTSASWLNWLCPTDQRSSGAQLLAFSVARFGLRHIDPRRIA